MEAILAAVIFCGSLVAEEAWMSDRTPIFRIWGRRWFFTMRNILTQYIGWHKMRCNANIFFAFNSKSILAL